jgi:hypothetical protein
MLARRDSRCSLEARGYSLLVLLVTLASFLFVKLLSSRRQGSGPWTSFLARETGSLSVFILFYHLAGSRGVPILLLAFLFLSLAAVLPP